MGRQRLSEHHHYGTAGHDIPYVEFVDEVSDFPNHSQALATQLDYLFSTNAGPKGDSAYDVWIKEGNVGDEQDFLASLKGNDGADGTGVNILGSYDTEGDLLAAHPIGNPGDAYLVGDGDLYVWDPDNNQWTNAGNIQGPEGQQGLKGPHGDSAYDVATDNGFVGDEAAWLGSLVGAKGDKGDSAYEVWFKDNGGTRDDYYDDIKGETGDKGEDGDSAYEVWLSDGNTGSEGDFLADIKGAPGKDGTDGLEGLQGLPGVPGDPGDPGLSPYEYWLDKNYPGSSYPDHYDDFEDTIRGPKGSEGHSAYQSYLDTNPQPPLSETDWVASLKGEPGEPGVGINMKGEVNTIGELPTTGNDLGDGWLVNGQLYVWLEDDKGALGWHDAGKIQGPEGPQGNDGLSAYEIWLKANNGTEQEFLDSLIGPAGPAGQDGQDGKDVDPNTLAALQQEVTDNHNKILALEARIAARENLDTWGSLNTSPTP